MNTCYISAQSVPANQLVGFLHLEELSRQLSLSSAVSLKYSSSSKLMTRSHWLCFWLSFSQIMESTILISVYNLIKPNFICALLCVAKPSMALIKKDTRCQVSELQKKWVLLLGLTKRKLI